MSFLLAFSYFYVTLMSFISFSCQGNIYHFYISSNFYILCYFSFISIKAIFPFKKKTSVFQHIIT